MRLNLYLNFNIKGHPQNQRTTKIFYYYKVFKNSDATSINNGVFYNINYYNRPPINVYYFNTESSGSDQASIINFPLVNYIGFGPDINKCDNIFVR